MKNIRELYIQHCIENNIEFKVAGSIIPDDNTTLFTTAGMQNLKSLFLDKSYKDTFANIQPCLRINDIDEISDGSHLLYFNMIGYFSFRQRTIKEVFDFFITFLNEKLEVNLSDLIITVHPDKLDDWDYIYEPYYPKGLIVTLDKDCKWSDGNIGGYCTEFYINDIEIGNIVNPLEDCIDVGFGLERLDLIVNGISHSKKEVLINTINEIISNGIEPSAKKQGYVLRKLIGLLLKEININDLENYSQFIKNEYNRIEKSKVNYFKNKDKHKNKSKEWWFDTYGIDISEM